MTKKTSIKDIAKRVGVSIASVSYVLNENGKKSRVSKEVAERIRKAARELNYQPNLLARSLQSGRSWTIGLIVADISNPFFSNIARVVEDEASTHHYTVLFGSSDENAEKSQILINTLINRQVDGLIIAPAEHTACQVQALANMNFPFVLIDRYFPGVETNLVRIDNFEASRKAVSHLIENGYRRTTMFIYNSNLQHMRERKNGFLQALKDYGMRSNKLSVRECSYDSIESDMKKIMHELLDNDPAHRPDSFFFGTNSLAVCGLREISHRHMNVPEEVGVVSFDESEALDFFYSPITYVNQQTAQIAKEAVRNLVRQLKEREKAGTKSANCEQIIVNAELIVRTSSKKKRPGKPGVSASMSKLRL